MFQTAVIPNHDPIPLDDLRRFLSIRLTVAPCFWFQRLWTPNVAPSERDRMRAEIVDFIAQGWERYRVTVEERDAPDPRQHKLL